MAKILLHYTDSLGNTVEIGKVYGYYTESSGNISVTFGIVDKLSETRNYASINPMRQVSAIYDDELTPDRHINNKNRQVKTIKLFPVNPNDINYGSTHPNNQK